MKIDNLQRISELQTGVQYTCTIPDDVHYLWLIEKRSQLTAQVLLRHITLQIAITNNSLHRSCN